MSGTTNAPHSPATQTSASAQSPVQGGGLIPDMVRDSRQQSTCRVDGVEAERGTAERMAEDKSPPGPAGGLHLIHKVPSVGQPGSAASGAVLSPVGGPADVSFPVYRNPAVGADNPGPESSLALQQPADQRVAEPCRAARFRVEPRVTSTPLSSVSRDLAEPIGTENN